MPPGGPVLLAWARDRQGAKVAAAHLRAGERRSRAPFTCLGCGEELVPHLGRVRARHFAHRPGSRCPLAAPETALHLDAKERLLALCAAAFSGALRVTVHARCSRCRRVVPLGLEALGDEAASEVALGPLRADVLVRSRGAPSLAFEVRVTHAVEPAKEAALAAAGVPFVEIDARAEWRRDVAGGVELATVRSGGLAPCPACADVARADADRARGGEAARVAELEAYRARGLLGTVRPGHGAGSPAGGRADRVDLPLSGLDRRELSRVFRCPSCGSRSLSFGERLAEHACPGAEARPVAWRGYDGTVVQLSWWRRG